MTWDLYLCIALMILLSAGMFGVGVALRNRMQRTARFLLAGATLLAIGVYLRFVAQQIWVIRLLPLTNLVVLGNLLPPLGALFGGLAWGLIPGRPWRRCITTVPLLAVCFGVAYHWLFMPAPHCMDAPVRGFLIQTSESTCAPAAAVTLLRMNGIETTECEMARLCLTGRNGTDTWAAWRGLKLKTNGTPVRVEPVSGDIEDLRRLSTPVLLRVGMTHTAHVDPRYERDWGWEKGRWHTVVLLGFRGDDLVAIADPSIGLENWNEQAIRDLWDGVGFTLRPRTSNEK